MSIKTLMTLEGKFVNVQRLLSMLKVPQENLEGDLPLEVFKDRFPTWPSDGHIEF